MIRNEKSFEEQIKEHEAEIAKLKALQEEETQKQKEEQLAAEKSSRKEDAEAVKAAITARLEQETATRKAKAEAYKVYLEACDEAEKKLSEARQAEKSALNNFCDKHGSYHDTITIDDVTYTCNYSKESYSDPFKKLLDFWGF